MALQRLYLDQTAIRDQFPGDFVGLDGAMNRDACLKHLVNILTELEGCDREPDEWEMAHIASARGAVLSGMFSTAVTYAFKAVVPSEERVPKFAGYNDMTSGTLLQLRNGVQRMAAIQA